MSGLKVKYINLIFTPCSLTCCFKFAPHFLNPKLFAQRFWNLLLFIQFIHYIKNGLLELNDKDISVKMPNLYNVVDDIKNAMYPNGEVTFEVLHRPTHEEPNRWVVYMAIPNGHRRAKVEFLIDEDLDDTEDAEVLGCVLRHGSVSRRTVSLIMDAILERM